MGGPASSKPGDGSSRSRSGIGRDGWQHLGRGRMRLVLTEIQPVLRGPSTLLRACVSLRVMAHLHSLGKRNEIL